MNALIRHRGLHTLRVLGIESSCDDTAAAVVTSDGHILSEINRHQHSVHEEFGGIVPALASNHHLQHMPLVIRETLQSANLSIDDIDAVAVTRGPGMPGSLTVCLSAGKALAAAHAKPLIGVHHMEAHALMARMGKEEEVQFPYLCLLISGGHTLSLVVHDVNQYTAIGSTRDDSVGEAFDKVARELNIPWLHSQDGGGPGPALERVAATGDPKRFSLPVPMDKSDTAGSLDFSFSGLKAHIKGMRERQAFDIGSKKDVADVAAAFQRTAAKHLFKKTNMALSHAKQHLGINGLKCLVVSGGVASNMAIRRSLEEVATKHKVPVRYPEQRLCTDNGVMIAWAGIERMKRGLLDPYTIDFKARWPLEELKTMDYVRRTSSF